MSPSNSSVPCNHFGYVRVQVNQTTMILTVRPPAACADAAGAPEQKSLNHAVLGEVRGTSQRRKWEGC